MYKKALTAIENSTAFKQLNIETYSLSRNSISFNNQAYAFWLDDSSLPLGDTDFENYFGELYTPIEIKSFAALSPKRRAKFILFVTETNDNLFVIEVLLLKRKRRAKYPKFYQGVSYSFLFKKEGNDIRLLRSLRVENN